MRATGASSLIILAALFCATPAQAADMRGTYIAPVAQAPIAYGDSGFYLRGDLGYSVTRVSNILFLPANGAGERTLSHSTQNAFLASVGAGYQFNAMLRGDITLEHRTQSGFNFRDRTENAGAPALYYLNDVKGKHGAHVALVNGYVNFASFNRFTPFLGLGLGIASVSTTNVTLAGTGPGNPASHGRGDDATKQNFAWALHAGLGYDMGSNWTLEASYRYLNMGSVKGGEMNCFVALTGTYTKCGQNTHSKGLSGHDFKVGLRYLFATPAPLPAFTPQPGYGGAHVAASYPEPAAMPLTRKY